MTKSTKTNHYTYIIRHVNGRYYVGRRSTKKDTTKDPYMGSGNWVRKIKDKSTLTKTIIAYYPTSEELKVAEMELIEKYFDDVYCMNILYSSGGFSSEDVSGDKNPQFGKTGKLSTNYGIKFSEKTKQLMSDSKSGDKNPNYGKTGELCHNYGRKHTGVSKKKMSDAQSGEKSHRATITDHIVKIIKIRISEGLKNKPIAEEFNTTVGVVSHIRSGRRWKHVTI
jgi:NUMOD3 motif